MSAELLLSIRTFLVLNPSTMIVMTNESSWGCFIPRASSSEKYMSWFVRLYFRRGRLWTLFTCLRYDFLGDLNDPPVDGPPIMVFISPTALCGRGGSWSSSLLEPSCWSFLLSLYLLESPIFKYFCSFPFRMSSSIYSFRSRQSFV